MKTSVEINVLQLFERVLEEPAAAREHWLLQQGLPEPVLDRVRRLLHAEREVGGFMAEAPVADMPAFPGIGERLGAYELLKPIEAGGMGVVFLGRRADDAYQQQVAIKLVRPIHLAGAGIRRQLIERFERERAILARMNHPNVARILDGGSTDSGIPYLVMEYVNGISLIDHCQRQGLDVEARLRLFCKVCDGVQEAHRHLIVHRDLKPDNILVGENGEPRLLDFGIAKILEQEPLDPRSGHTALTAMTPAYASPEQVRQEVLTTSSDVYSLGVVLYQLLAGRRPYELAGLTPAEAERVVCDGRVATLADALADAPLDELERRRRRAQFAPDLERIVAMSMHKDAIRRYRSAQELGDDVRRYLSGRPVLAHPDSLGYRMGKALRRHRGGFALGALALVAVLAATSMALWQARQAYRSAQDMEEVNGFLIEILSASDPFNEGSEITLSQALDDGAARVDERFGERPDLAAPVRHALGYSMLSRYRLEGAETQLLKSLEEARAAFGSNDIRSLRVLESLALLRQEQRRIADAESLFGQVIERLRESGQTADPLYGIVLNNLGVLLLVEEKYEQAAEQFKLALAHMDRNTAAAHPNDRANLLGNLAHAAHGLEDLDRADALYAEAQQELEALYPEGHPEIAILLNNRALLAGERGDDDAALQLHLASAAQREAAFSGPHLMTVRSHTNVSRQAAVVGDRNLALDYSQRALEAAPQVFRSPHQDQVLVHVARAEALLLAPADPEAADEQLQFAQQLLDEVDNPIAAVPAYVAKVSARLCGIDASRCR